MVLLFGKKAFFLALILIYGVPSLYAAHPLKNYIIVPDSLHLAYREYNIETPDSARLNLWVLDPDTNLAPDRHTTIIMSAHDYGNKSYCLYNGGVLAQSGFTVVLFDYRGFGGSSGFTIEGDRLYYPEFVTDLKSVLQWSRKNITNVHTGLYGLSMGTIISILAIQNEKVDFLIEEGVVTDLQEEKKRLKAFKNKDITLPEDATYFSGVLARTGIPMLIFAGTEDSITTVADAQKIVGEYKNRKVVTFPAGHLGGLQALTKTNYGDVYVQNIIQFLKEHKIESVLN